MKKVTILMAGALLAAGFSACTQAPKANIQSKNDSLSYYVGMSNAQGVKSYIMERMDIDSAYMDEVIRGIVEGAGRTAKKDVAYLTGISIGQQISNMIMPSLNEQIFAGDSTQAMDAKNFLAGFLDGAVEKGGAMAFDEARIYADKLVEEAQEASLRKINADYIAENEKFLENNKAKEGVQTTPSGLQYKIITAGTGEIPTDSSTVKVNYTGKLIDGTEFDSSKKNNKPATFRVDRVVKGWTEALTMMPVGSKWELYIPESLGYGSRAMGKIKPFSTLVFEVELVSIEPEKKK